MDRPEVDAVLRLSLRAGGRSPRSAEVSEPGEGRHELGVTGLGRLLEIRGLQALLGCGSLGRVVPSQGESVNTQLGKSGLGSDNFTHFVFFFFFS